MVQFYQTGRLLSAVAFILFTAGAMGILFEDVLLKSAPVQLKHFITLVVIGGTIMVGHLAHKARGLATFGFVLLFLAGTGLVVFSSVGRQGEALAVTQAQAEADAEARRSAKKGLERSEAMIAEAQSNLAKECKSGNGKRCSGIKATIDVYQAAAAGHQAKLASIGPPKMVAPEAEKLAEIAAVFGANHEKVKAGVILVQPFFLCLFLEFGSILTLGFALRGGSRKAKGLQPQPQPTVVQKSGEEPSQELAKAPIVPQPIVPSKDASQTSFPEPSPRDFPALRAAGLLSEDKPNPRRIN